MDVACRRKRRGHELYPPIARHAHSNLERLRAAPPKVRHCGKVDDHLRPARCICREDRFGGNRRQIPLGAVQGVTVLDGAPVAGIYFDLAPRPPDSIPGGGREDSPCSSEGGRRMNRSGVNESPVKKDSQNAPSPAPTIERPRAGTARRLPAVCREFLAARSAWATEPGPALGLRPPRVYESEIPSPAPVR